MFGLKVTTRATRATTQAIPALLVIEMSKRLWVVVDPVFAKS